MATTYEAWEDPADLPLLQVGISQQTQYRPAFTDDLIGQRLVLHMEDGERIEHHFDSIDALTRQPAGRDAARRRRYDATRVREGIYLVDMLVDEDLPDAEPGIGHEESWALDLNSGRVTVVKSWVQRDRHDRRWTRSSHEHAVLGGKTSAGRHERSSGMVGRRVLWRYSDTDFYDHVYLNDRNFAWQCVAGVEQGLTELDRTTAYAVADELYLFGWSEHVQPVESSLLVDLREMRTYGRFFGWEERTGERLHHQFGAEGVLLNVTSYPAAS